MRLFKRHQQPCDCEPFDIGDGEIVDHEGDCPRYYDHLRTADDIANFRRCLLLWAAEAPSPVTTAKMAAGVTARAIELGIERP